MHLVESAARNNARWCDAVCRAHGNRCEFLPGAWIDYDTPPPYYPNLVTIERASDPALAGRTIRELAQRSGRHGWTVKDSFAELDLARLGFDELFAATWIALDAEVARGSVPELRFRRVGGAEELQRWERSWRMASGEESTSSARARFPAALLGEPFVQFLGAMLAPRAADRARAPAAGAVLASTDGVVGVSNLFSIGIDPVGAWRALAAYARSLAPANPVVGYERGEPLEAARSAGFRAIGALRVWVRNRG